MYELYFITIGFIVGTIFHFITMYLYKSILISKSKNNSAEYIRGKFYYIKEEIK